MTPQLSRQLIPFHMAHCKKGDINEILATQRLTGEERAQKSLQIHLITTTLVYTCQFRYGKAKLVLAMLLVRLNMNTIVFVGLNTETSTYVANILPAQAVTAFTCLKKSILRLAQVLADRTGGLCTQPLVDARLMVHMLAWQLTD